MKHTALAKRYARALVDLVGSSGEAARLAEELALLAQVHDESREWREVMANPLFAKDRRGLAEALVAEMGLGAETRRALLYLIERGRQNYVGAVSQAIATLLESKTGRLKAQLLTPAPLPKDRLERIRAALERISGKRIVLEETIDPTLIGGVVTRIGSLVYDGSLKANLDQFRTSSAKES